MFERMRTFYVHLCKRLDVHGTMPIDRHDDGGDYVSMHHRIRLDLRRRLKHIAVDLHKPVTDIVNDAIVAHLDRIGVGAVSLSQVSAPAVLGALREARRNGAFYETVASLDKPKLVEVSRLLGEAADLRSSGDRLVSRIAVALAEPVPAQGTDQG